MKRLTEQVHDLLRQHITVGDVVVDATIGNGHDTVFLAGLVGPEGNVFGFDTQADALATTWVAFEKVGPVDQSPPPNVTLLHSCHSQLADRVPREHHGLVSAVVFNLGYLPGGPSRLETTTASTTVAALHASLKLLKPNGVVSVLAYVGHPGGIEEAEAVERTFESLEEYQWLRRDEPNGPSPRLFFVRRSADPEVA